MQLKEYFWQVIPDCDKDYLNFGFIRRSRHFQKERCEKILQCDPEKGRELVEACKDSGEIREADMAQVLEGNRSLSEPFPKPDGYEDAQRELKEVEFSEILKKYCSVN